jgi:hypothetical protein
MCMSPTMCLCRSPRATILPSSAPLALLRRLYEPTTGRITIGNAELWKIDIRYLRYQMSVVSQHLDVIAHEHDSVVRGSARTPGWCRAALE